MTIQRSVFKDRVFETEEADMNLSDKDMLELLELKHIIRLASQV